MGIAAALWQNGYEAWVWVLDHVWYINLCFSIAIVFFQRRDPKSVWTWLFALNFIPVFGVIVYLLIGQDYRKSKMFRVKEVEDSLRFPVKSQEELLRRHPGMPENQIVRDFGGLILYNLENSGSVLTADNHLEIFTDGEEKFADLRQELRRATHHIHLQYYIIKNDQVFHSIIPIL